MPEPLNRCEYFLVEYAPSGLRDLRIPLGLYLFYGPDRLVQHAFTRDLRHIRCLDPDADLGLLTKITREFDGFLRGTSQMHQGAAGIASDSADTVYQRLRQMQDEFSGGIRISQPKGVMAADPKQEFARLFQEHVAPVRRDTSRHTAGSKAGSRRWIRAQFSEALIRHNLSDRLMKDVSVDAFTTQGDTFRINYAYRPNGITKYLHAISLERDWTQAKLLSYTSWRIREKVPAQFTAIVADINSESSGAESCRRILTDSDIAVRPLSQIDPYLEEVRRELEFAQ